MAKKTTPAAATRGPQKKTGPAGPATKGAKGAKPKGPTTGNAKMPSLEDLDNAWNESLQKPTGFEVPDIEDGDYVFRVVSASLSTRKKAPPVPQMRFRVVVVFGAYAGVTLSNFNTLSNEPVGETGMTQMDLFKKSLEGLGLDPTKYRPSQFAALAESLTEENPYFRGNVKNSSWNDKTTGEEKHGVRCYFNGAVTEAELKELRKTMEEYDPFVEDND